jgi:hypothetical protein
VNLRLKRPYVYSIWLPGYPSRLVVGFLVPALAMRFTHAVAGALLFGTGLAYELVARKAGTLAYWAALLFRRAQVGLRRSPAKT